MIHVFDLTPPPDEKVVASKFIINFLPGCSSLQKDGVCNWISYPLNATWSLYSNNYSCRERNVDIWRNIVKGISKRVNDDTDDSDAIDVFCIAKHGSPSILATLIYSRNEYLKSLLDDKVSQEEFDVSYKYTKIWVPIFEQIFLTEEEQNRDRKGRRFRRKFICWTQV